VTDTGHSIPSDDLPDMAIGYVRRAHGIRGDVLIRGMVLDAEDRFIVEASLTTNEDPVRLLEVASVRLHDGDYLVKLRTINSRNHAQELVGVQFVVDKSDRRDLDADEWWVEDLVGCAVVDLAGLSIGSVTSVEVGAAQDRLVVETVAGERGEVPLVAEIVHDVDIKDSRIVANLPEGLFE
jgi:16S rRNA processing protein RimM